MQQLLLTFVTNTIGHKATTIIGLVIGAIGIFVSSATTPANAGLLPPSIVTDLGYIVSFGVMVFGAAVKNPNSNS